MLKLVHHLASAGPSNALAQGYTALAPEALRFFTHEPRRLDAAVASRSAYRFPRRELARVLGSYNASVGGPPASVAAAESLAAEGTLCVISGQQAGFMGGPLYTAYKIATTVRIARDLAAATGSTVVPVFWLASEDHDFQEINHTFALGDGGEIRRISFSWSGAGRPVSDLPMTPEVQRALARYLAETDGALGSQSIGDLFSPEPTDSYCSWIARVLHRTFGSDGLVIVEPRLLAPLSGELFARAFRETGGIRERLTETAARLSERGYPVSLDAAQAGVPFRFTPAGLRLRAEPDPKLAERALREPSAFSTDAALRPLFQDAIFPNVVSVLGPGEIAYQAMLKPLYELFEVPQPLLLPRLSLTAITSEEAELLEGTKLRYEDILQREFSLAPVLREAVPEVDRAAFDGLRQAIGSAMEPAAAHVRGLDPNLELTAKKTLATILRAVSRLEERSHRARLARGGMSTRRLHALRAALCPRGVPQERTFPLPFLLRRHGVSVASELPWLADPLDYRHHVAVDAGSRGAEPA